MSDKVERMIYDIERKLFTHDGKFPKGFNFLYLADLDQGEKISAVYILLNDTGLLYVGQSKDVVRRIKDHKRRGVIPFTMCACLAIHPDLRDEMERGLIWNYKPPYNKSYLPLIGIARHLFGGAK